MKKIALVPIDNRPICYDLIEDITGIDNSIKLFMPKIEDLGGLHSSANIRNIFNFLESLDKVDYLVVSLDTIAYGGLISSRRCENTFEEIKNRIEKFKDTASKKAKKILAFSSIMRISNNNINEEEKEYWAYYGKEIFDWSVKTHKLHQNIINKIPSEILDDYLKTRKRNFDINKIYLKWAQEGFFDTLIFSKDDCAEYGLNVKEAKEIEEIIKEKNIKSAKVKTGADEIPLALLSNILNSEEKISVSPIFVEENSINLISKYEDITVKNCVLSQLELANCTLENKKPDLTLVVNNFKDEQGDLVLGDKINMLENTVEFPKTPYFIADINNANGADKKFIRELFNQKTENFYGYCGYNTSANTLGCAILTAIVKFLAKKNKTYNELAFKKLQLIRLLDDWAFQSISRKPIRETKKDFSSALKDEKNELDENAKIISEFLDFKYKNIEYSLPWDRSFEIRIKVEE